MKVREHSYNLYYKKLEKLKCQDPKYLIFYYEAYNTLTVSRV